MVVPSGVDLVVDILISDVGGEAQPPAAVLVGGRGVDHEPPCHTFVRLLVLIAGRHIAAERLGICATRSPSVISTAVSIH